MKKILVPTDFSENAQNALDYAVEIANEFGSIITLLHTYTVPTSTGSFISIEQFIKEDAEKEMSSLRGKLAKKLTNSASLQSEIRYGNSDSFIAKVATNFDLVVMGTQGKTGLKDIFIGSTAAATIRESTTPVLIIPHGTIYTRPEKIVFAVDNLSIENSATVAVLKGMAQQFSSQLHLFHLDKEKKGSGIDWKLGSYFEDIEVNFNYQVGGESLNESINEFAEKQNADLLCMLRRKRGFWERLFHDSATKREVFSSILPILILEEK